MQSQAANMHRAPAATNQQTGPEAGQTQPPTRSPPPPGKETTDTRLAITAPPAPVASGRCQSDGQARAMSGRLPVSST